MFSDIAIPKNNEAEFFEIASRLNVKKLYFLYDFDSHNEEKIKNKLDSINHKNISVEMGFIVSKKNLNKAAKISRLLVARSSELDRFFIESKKIKLIFGFEEFHKRDYLHQRASGLNHVICDIANKNNVVVGFSYGQLFNNDKMNSAVLLGRLMQNISLCQKYNLRTVIGAFSSNPFDLRYHYDISSLFGILGMGGKNIKESLDYTL